MTDLAMDQVLLTSAEVGHTLGISPPMVRWYARDGRLAAVRWPSGRLLRFWARGLVQDPPRVQGVLGVEDVAGVLRVHHDVVYGMARRGEIPMSRRLFGWGISAAPLLDWMEDHTDGEHDPELLRRHHRGRSPLFFETNLDSDLAIARVVRGQR